MLNFNILKTSLLQLSSIVEVSVSVAESFNGAGC